ncbi:GNAT family N-acetyltransferase [Pelagibius sp. 7325]|uniref:GNAT family N-acetyltransferase n=1 Tax=Pelagibius sp. 7325 TaxID=3131994 RepID=UPI0030EEFAE0
MAALRIAPATEAEMDSVRVLFREYADWLQVDYCLQAFESELAGLPGAYAPPVGGLWLARIDGAPAGVVGLWPLGDGACEVKRLWVRPASRGEKLGRRLMDAALAGARAAGHKRVVLETLDFMTAARALYADLGFREVDKGDAPENVRRMACDLAAAAPA